MADQFTEVTQKSWWQNITGSFAGVLIGIVVFLASFYVLWTNEGRVDFSKVAELSIQIPSARIDSEYDGKFVSASGILSSDDLLGDAGLLKPGKYIKLNRIAEMYAWDENVKTETSDKMGGGTEEKKTYTYSRKWTENPEDSGDFKYSQGHENPSMAIKSEQMVVQAAKVGAYGVETEKVSFPGGEEIGLTDQNTVLAGRQKLESDHIYIGGGSMQSPSVGDIRIKYAAVKNGIKATVFGKVESDYIQPYYYKAKDRLYRIFSGTRDEAIAQMAGEYKMMVWIVRLVGFLMMWFGLFSLFGPISEVLDVLPILGKVTRGLAGFATLVAALVISAVTIILAMIAHNIYFLIGFIAVIIGGYFYLKQGKKKAA